MTDTGWITEDIRRFVATSGDHVHVAAPAEVAEVIAWLCTGGARRGGRGHRLAVYRCRPPGDGKPLQVR
jgi:hypothetical protein